MTQGSGSWILKTVGWMAVSAISPLCLLVSANTWAASGLGPPPPLDEEEEMARPSPPHSVSLGYSKGQEEFSEGRVSATFKPAHALRITGDWVKTHVAENQDARELEGIVTWAFQDPQSIELAAASTTGTIQLMSHVFTGDYRYDLSTLWQGENLFELRLGLDYHDYFTSVRDAFTVWGYRGGLTAELNDWITLGLSGEIYSKPELSAILQQFVRVVVLVVAKNPDLLPQSWSASGYLNFELGPHDELKATLATYQTVNTTAVNYNPTLEWAHDFSRQFGASLNVSTTAVSGHPPESKAGVEATFRFGTPPKS